MTAPIQQLRQDIAAQFPEPREVIEGTLYALLYSDHILLLGGRFVQASFCPPRHPAPRRST